MNNLGAKKGTVYVHPATIEFYAKQTWKFAKTMLWNNTPFLPEEVELCLEYLKDYYRSIPPKLFIQVTGDYFREFCERILLVKSTAKETAFAKHCEFCGNGFTPKHTSKKYCTDTCRQRAYFKRNGFSLSGGQPLRQTQQVYQNHHIPHPCIWLNPLNPNGFLATKIHMHEIPKAAQGKLKARSLRDVSLDPINHYDI